jgi:transcriptional regulator with XRE-family HTH domain
MNENTEKNQSIGTRLLTLRNESNLTQEELAEKLDVSRQSISKWELNKTLPDVEKLIQLSDMYQVSMDYLIKGKRRKKKNSVRKSRKFVLYRKESIWEKRAIDGIWQEKVF